jgi:exopolysaccharide biosynthesis polyprenyl glycosylphosphotransferase
MAALSSNEDADAGRLHVVTSPPATQAGRRDKHWVRLPGSLNLIGPGQAAAPLPRAALEPPIVTGVEREPSLQVRRTPRWQSRFVKQLIVGDLVAGLLAASFAVLVRFPGGASRGYQLATAIFPLGWVASCAAARAYEARFLGTGSEEFRRVFDAGVRLLGATALVAFAARLDLARLYALVAFPSVVGLSLLIRYVARQQLHRRREAGRSMHRVIVVGRERACAELVQQFRREPQAGFSVTGICTDAADADVEDVPVLGRSDQVVDALRQTGADTVAVAAWSDFTQSDLRRLSWELEGSGVSLVVAPSLADIAGPRIHIRPVAGLPLLHVEEPEFSGARRLLKGAFDRSSAGLLLLLVSPIMIAIALAVRVTSRGPAFFRQTRVGIDGRDFTIYKFRSMYADAEARFIELQAANDNADGLLFKIREDPRVTPVGRWIRRYSLDELPQLINIVRGDMSVVGPRPPLPREVSQYGSDVRRRLLVKPGLTGLWQISGRSNLSWDESVRLDLHYVENWSLALDFMIVWKTLFAVLKREGAY